MNKQNNDTKQLPKDWKIVKLNEAGKIISGGTPSTAIQEYWNGNINWISPADLTGYKKKTIIKGAKSITDSGLKNSSARLMPAGSVLFSSRAPIGYVAIAADELSTNQGFKSIIPNENVQSEFLYYFLKASKQSAEKVASGTTFKEISLSKFSELDFPLPPKPTQQAIVSKIEELFSELDKGIENLHTAQQQLKTYRQSVLKWAFEGKLTNENVKEGELPTGWKLVQIKDVAETYGGYAFKSGEFKTQGKYQVLRMGNVRPGILRYDESPVFLNKVDENVLSRSLLQINDIIITQTGTRKKRDYGFTVLIPKTNLLLNQRIAAIRFKEKYLPKFFLYFSWTDLFKDQFFENETGNVGQGNVGMKAVTETLIPFCSIDEQHNIVQAIESRLSVADKMEESITQSLQQAEALRQSILKKAFEGKLI
ncbi:MAG: restriction endonuclease subunit S [Chitinophagaceae bacterium]